MIATLVKKIVAPVLMVVLFSCEGWGDFYVIPINKKVEHVILVAKKGGDFTDVKAAVDSIADASESNRYLVYVGPGVYTVTAPIRLKAWVTLKGSGENVTLFTGSISGDRFIDSAIVVGEDNATLTELAVENKGGGDKSIGIYNDNAAPTISNVKVTAFGGDNENVGIYNNSSSPTISNVKTTAFGGTYSSGVYNSASPASMNNVTAMASNGRTGNYGVYNYYSSPTLYNMTAIASGGSGNNANYGIHDYYSSPIMKNVTATAYGGNLNFGIYNNRSTPKIYHSVAEGDTDAIGNNNATPICHYVLGIVGSNYNELNASCD